MALHNLLTGIDEISTSQETKIWTSAAYYGDSFTLYM
jgi:hypothetical protein